MNTQEKRDQEESTSQPRAGVNPNGIGKALLGYMSDKGLNQRELAQLVNIPAANLSAICTGKRQCGTKLARRFADALKLDGREGVAFLNLVRMPKWKGLENTPNNPEAILGNWLSRELASSGIPINQIASVVPLDLPADLGADAYIIMKDGVIFELDLKIRKKQQ